MMREMIATARRLAARGKRKPSQADLRRAISTIYYALFGALARTCADEIAGSSTVERSSDEWLRVYRALNHGRSEAALDELWPQWRQRMRRGLPPGMEPAILNFCETVERLKQLRHSTDYDPRDLALQQVAVLSLIDEAEATMEDLATAPAGEHRALAFACIVSLRRG